jgi:hypothetical protein
LFKGALNFTNHLFKLQTNTNEYGSNLAMRRFKDYLSQIYDDLENENVDFNKKADELNKKHVHLMQTEGNLLVNIERMGQIDKIRQSS